MRNSKISFGVAAFAGALLLIGCGGQQNSTNSSFGGGSAGGYGAFGPNGMQNRQAQQANAEAAQQVPVFFSDGSGTPNEHFWVKVYEIDITTSSSTSVVFLDPQGKLIDLKTLREKDGPRFAYMGSFDPKTGDVVRASVTIDKNYTIKKPDAAELKTGTLTDPNNLEGDKIKLMVNLNPRLTKGDKPAIVIDFDTKKFSDIDEKKSTLVAKVGDTSGIDEKNQQIPTDFSGTLSSIAGSAPALSFSVGFGDNRSIRVNSDSQTAIFSIDGQVNPTLSDGNIVDVRGAYRFPERQFIAQTVRVRDVDTKPSPNALIGSATKWDAAKGTFEIAPASASGFIPADAAVQVAILDNTMLLDGNGSKTTKEDLDKVLAKSAAVEIEGIFDKDTNTFKASWVKLAKAVVTAPKADPKVKPADGKTAADGKTPTDGKTQPAADGKAATIQTPENPIPSGAQKTPALADGSVEGIAIIESLDPDGGTFILKNVTGQGLKAKVDSMKATTDDNTAFQDLTGSLIGKTQFYKQAAKGKNIIFKGDLKDGVLVLRRILVR